MKEQCRFTRLAVVNDVSLYGGFLFSFLLIFEQIIDMVCLKKRYIR